MTPASTSRRRPRRGPGASGLPSRRPTRPTTRQPPTHRRPGIETQEYDAIKADLDRELAGVDDEEPPSEELEAEAEEPPSEEPEAEADEPASEDEPSEESEAVGQPSGETVEAETVSLADREQAEEEALAGLRARVAKDKPDGEPVAAGVAAATADAEEDAGRGRASRRAQGRSGRASSPPPW